MSYFFNRSPLKGTAFAELPLGTVKPEGWLKDQLKIQANGMTGKLPEHWDYLGSNSGWLGGDGESWERGPYYLDGLYPLAVLLEDEELLNKAKKWIEWTLNSQTENGWYGPAANDDWWCRMIMNKVLMQHEEATGDPRVIPFLLKYYRFQYDNLDARPLSGWSKARGGEDILCIQWLYNRTEENFLLDLMEKVHNQTEDWTGIYNQFPYWRYQTRFDHRIHVVNVAMSLKEPSLYYLVSGDEKHETAAMNGIKSLMNYHGQLNGMFSGDEWLAGTSPSQGTELCAVVEYMLTLENLFRIHGDGIYGDILEKVAFNALPATISEDWTGHQYDQQVNQIRCNSQHRNWTSNKDDSNMFGLEPNFGCCTANMHQGWPKYASRLWMATEDKGLAALSYAPCSINTYVADGVKVCITVETEYPFREKVSIKVSVERSTEFPIKLRIPQWCKSPVANINGSPVQLGACNAGMAVLRRQWDSGDAIELMLPMNIYAEPRGNNAVGIFRGPLLYALPLKEVWVRHSGNLPFANYNVLPAKGSKWNYGLVLDKNNPEASFAAAESSLENQPFSPKQPPVVLKGKACRVPQWIEEMNSAGNIPISPVKTDEPQEDIELIPYGGARLRIAEFPYIEK